MSAGEGTPNEQAGDGDDWQDTYVSAWSVEEGAREIRHELDEMAAHGKAILHHLGATPEGRLIEKHVNAILEGVSNVGDHCVDLIGLALDGRSESEIAAAPPTAVASPPGDAS